jgi:DNA-binding transcriptional ArsR family regulator
MSDTSPSRKLMDLTIGYWASQAVHVAARLAIADHLADGQLTGDELAARTGAHGPSLSRLLRFLVELGIVEGGEREGYRVTETGALLRTEQYGSMRDLALLYGEEFYTGWGSLLHTVTTGQNAFESVHGAAMYPYFGQTPELTRKFDRAMAAGSEFFERIPAVYDFGGARTVVDIAGGNGALLAEVLRANPQARGVLFDTGHVIEAARRSLTDTDIAERVDYACGDYYEKVPAGGDVYLLSRILHGRDDDRCADVLARVREAIPDDGVLLIIERVIPEDGTPSLAVWFDVHMMTVAGGVERTRSQYQALLERGGFALTEVHELPLDIQLLVAVPHAATGR